MDTVTLLFSILAGSALLSGIGLGVKAWYERRTLHAQAGNDEANATTVLVAAARELVDPLRKELAAERAEHAEELARGRAEHARDIEEERVKVAQVRKELDQALSDLQHLREELASALSEISQVKAINRALEAENTRLRERRLTSED